MLERRGDSFTLGTHIYFRNLGKMNGSKGYQRKTNIYEVYAKGDNFLLGQVRWYGRWRKYIFEPAASTIYEETCMREISQFIEEESRAQREKAKAARAS